MAAVAGHRVQVGVVQVDDRQVGSVGLLLGTEPEHHLGATVGHDPGEAVGGLVGVDGDEPAACPQHGEDRDDCLGPPRHVDHHRLVRHYAEGDQQVGELVRAPIELAVAERVGAAHHGVVERVCGRCGGDELVEGGVRRQVCTSGVVPLGGHGAAGGPWRPAGE